MNDLVGQQVDNYQIRELIGQGGMAAVYLARDVALQRDVVIKTMLPALAQNEELRLRFQREARATARLSHPNIVPIYTTGVTPTNEPYIALQYVEGGSLSDHLQKLAEQGRWLSAIYALAIVRQVADALTVAHQANIIHRDIKPSNILLRIDGTPVLSDLGIASVKQATTRLTQTGSVIGTPNYMSPEQASSQLIDGRSDIYSLGVILYEFLSGRLPFDGDSPWAMIHNHIYEQPTPLRQVRPDLTVQTYDVAETCLQKKPSDRYQEAWQLVAALDEALAAEDRNPQVSVGTWQPLVVQKILERARPSRGFLPGSKRKRPLWLYGLIGVILLLATAVVVMSRRDLSPTPTARQLSSSPVSATRSVVVQEALPPTSTLRPTAEEDALLPALALTPTIVPVEESTLAPTPSQEAIATTAYSDGLIAFSCGPGEHNQIYLSEPGSRSLFLLPGQPQNSVVPAFSLDGTQIAYRSNASGSWQIYASNIDGTNLRQVTSGPENNYEAVWSPDSGRFAFVSDRTGSRQIFVMNSDGTNQQQLTFNDAYNDDPSWSRSDQIIYESNQDGRFNIYRILAQGGTPEIVVSSGATSTTPAWSPDGQWLAFESETDNARHIWIATSEGTNLLRVTSEGSDNQRPAWSPDGTRLAFHSDYQQPDESLFDIWTIDIETGALQRITSRGDCFDSAWAQSNILLNSDSFSSYNEGTGATTPVSWPVSDTGKKRATL